MGKYLSSLLIPLSLAGRAWNSQIGLWVSSIETEIAISPPRKLPAAPNTEITQAMIKADDAGQRQIYKAELEDEKRREIPI